MSRKRAEKVWTGEPPTLEVIMFALGCAARKMGCDWPRDCLLSIQQLKIGPNSKRAFAISRTRIYAALALRALYEDTSPLEISLACGSRNADFFCVIDAKIRKRQLFWFKNAIFMEVLESTEKFMNELLVAA